MRRHASFCAVTLMQQKLFCVTRLTCILIDIYFTHVTEFYLVNNWISPDSGYGKLRARPVRNPITDWVLSTHMNFMDVNEVSERDVGTQNADNL